MPEDTSASSSGLSGEAGTRGIEAPEGAEQALDRQLNQGAQSHDDSLQPVIGMGGSAGSINALRSFFSHMGTDSGLAFVVIGDLSPDHESRIATLLQSFTSTPVVQVSDTVKVEANRVYVIPQAKHLSVADGQLCLSELLPERGRRVAVDLFFRTLAD